MSFNSATTRRQFLAWSSCAAVVAATPLLNTTVSAQSSVSPLTIYRLSCRGRCGASRAAKLHAANKRFRTPEAAELNRAHPGDRSRVVPLHVSEAEFQRLFVSSESGREFLFDVADLRHL